VGSPRFMFLLCFTRIGAISDLLMSCFCGIARIHVFYYVLHALGQHQNNELLLWDPRFMFSIVFSTHSGNIRLTSCFCGIARTHVFYYVLHALGQYQTNELLLWGASTVNTSPVHCKCSPGVLYIQPLCTLNTSPVHLNTTKYN
jgi:hypothetical protein